jgi:hypothetical protein
MIETCAGKELRLVNAASERRYRVQQPAPVELELFAVRTADGGIRVDVVADRRLDRFFARLERPGGVPVGWTSESADADLTLREVRARLRIGPTVVEGCAGCRLRVQAVAVEDAGDYPLFSETRVAVQLDDVR